MIMEIRFVIAMINLYILCYIFMLHQNKCQCSIDWRRDYIFYFSLFYIFSLVCFLLLPEIFHQNLHLVVWSKVILGILLLVNIYCLYSYTKKLEDEDCQCADKLGKNIMKGFSIFYLILIIGVFSYLIHYYVKGEYKNIKKLKRLHGRVSNNNLEKIVIVNRVN